MTPRKPPRGERPSDTIAFQNKQIRDMGTRIDELHQRLNVAVTLTGSQQDQIEKLQCSLEACQAKLAYETAHASGYRQRVYDEKLDASRIALERERRHTSMRNLSDAPF